METKTKIWSYKNWLNDLSGFVELVHANKTYILEGKIVNVTNSFGVDHTTSNAYQHNCMQALQGIVKAKEWAAQPSG